MFTASDPTIGPWLPAPNFQVHQIQLFDTAEGYGGGTSEERLRDVAKAANVPGDEKRQRKSRWFGVPWVGNLRKALNNFLWEPGKIHGAWMDFWSWQDFCWLPC